MIRKVKDVSELLERLKTRLRDYLEVIGTEFSSNGQHFQCPNRDAHTNNDHNPAAVFYPDDTSWHCFACNESGDIFSAAYYLEDKPKEGPDWVEETVVYLANLLDEEVVFRELTEDEERLSKIYKVLEDAALLAHKGFTQSKEAQDYIFNHRKWSKEIVGRS